jgi:hypothetical protein
MSLFAGREGDQFSSKHQIMVAINKQAAQLLFVFAFAIRTSQANQTAIFSGLNVPWNNFGYDIGGSYDANYFETFFTAAQAGGQNGLFYDCLNTSCQKNDLSNQRLFIVKRLDSGCIATDGTVQVLTTAPGWFV